MTTLDIIFSCDIKYIIPLITIINSIITNTSSQNKLRFNIVCDDTNKIIKGLQLLKKKHSSYNFTFNCISLKRSLDQAEFNFLSRVSYSDHPHTDSIYNFCRFWFDKLFPELDYIIYLDIDMIIEGDIFELANFKFNNTYFFAAVLGTITREYRIKDMNIDKSILQEFKINNNNLSFNAGLYVTSLFYWRKYKISEKIKDLMMRRYRNQGLYKLGTQPPLNILFYNKIINITDNNWMVSTLGHRNVHKFAKDSIEKKQAKCCHWTGKFKPWNTSRYREIYLKYLLHSVTDNFNRIGEYRNLDSNFLTITSVTRKREKYGTGQFFIFNKKKFISLVGFFSNNSTILVEQYRSKKKIWEGKVKYWDNHRGIHGRRNTNPRNLQWRIGDQIKINN